MKVCELITYLSEFDENQSVEISLYTDYDEELRLDPFILYGTEDGKVVIEVE